MTQELRRENGNHLWLKEHFEAHSPIRTAAEFAEIAADRQQEVARLPEEALALRQEVRNAYRIADEDVWVAFGEQPCGLNEPPLILGKRLLASYMARNYGWKPLEYFASSDVVGSEAGMYKLEVPYPFVPEGIKTINLVSGNTHNQTPASRVSTSEVNFPALTANILMVYKKHSPNISDLIGQMYLEYVQQEQPLSKAQNQLLTNLEHRLGLRTGKPVEDLDFDSKIAQLGALDLMLGIWGRVVEVAHRYENTTTRVPELQEAPFYAYPATEVSRPRIWFEDESLKRYVATHPFDKTQVVGRFTYDDIIEGKVGVTFRAIPRIILVATIFDAHITGGGAKYNEVARPTYEKLFGVRYLPLAWMDLTNGSGQEEGVFQYESLVLQRGKKGPGYQQAQEVVRQGKAGALDLAASLTGNEREIISDLLSQPNLEMSQRVDLGGK